MYWQGWIGRMQTAVFFFVFYLKSDSRQQASRAESSHAVKGI